MGDFVAVAAGLAPAAYGAILVGAVTGRVLREYTGSIEKRNSKLPLGMFPIKHVRNCLLSCHDDFSACTAAVLCL
jgi:hypothetical protein